MFPVLFHVGAYPVAAYGSALLVAFAVGIWIARWRGEAAGLSGRAIVDSGAWIFVAALVGARALYVVEHAERFRAPLGHWTQALNPLGATSGLSMTGGVLLAVTTAVFVFWHRGLPLLRYADVMAPSVALGEGITRIGCFLNGCCHGRACDWPWAVSFPEGSPAYEAFGAIAVHPAQLYASAAGFATFWILTGLARRQPRSGTVFFAYLVLGPAARMLLDTFRYYGADVTFARAPFELAFHQPVNAVLLAVGLLGFAAFRAPRALEQA